MKTTVIKRVLLSATMLVGVLGFAVLPASALPVELCPTPVIGEDGTPVTFECNPTPVLDTVAPVIHINNPNDTQLKKNQIVLITALGADAVGVVQTELYVDGTLVGSSSNPWVDATWTPTKRGEYKITAKAYDAAHNVGTSTLAVTVK